MAREKGRLADLQAWYLRQCDGEWEHSYGVKIDTLDNPGWSLTVDLRETALEQVPFERVEDNMDHDQDWMLCKVERGVFRAVGGPLRLTDMVGTFLDWASRVP